jgi:hypothetical protein
MPARYLVGMEEKLIIFQDLASNDSSQFHILGLFAFMERAPLTDKVKVSRYTPWRHMGGEEV